MAVSYAVLEDGTSVSMEPHRTRRRSLFYFCTIWVCLLLIVGLISLKEQSSRHADALKSLKERCATESQQLKEMVIEKNHQIEELLSRINELEVLVNKPGETGKIDKVQVTQDGHDEEQIKKEEEKTNKGAGIEETDGEEVEEGRPKILEFVAEGQP